MHENVRMERKENKKISKEMCGDKKFILMLMALKKPTFRKTIMFFPNLFLMHNTLRSVRRKSSQYDVNCLLFLKPFLNCVPPENCSHPFVVP